MTAAVQDAATWIRRFHPAPDAAARVVCFPHAGGSASFYFPVSAALSGRAEVLAVQYPGRQDRRADPCIDDIGELADQVADVLRPFVDRPTVFFGHSMGAILAFEVTRRLERDGLEIAGLFASGRRAPSCPRDEDVHTRDDDGIVAEIKALSGTDTSLLGDEEVLRMVLPAIRSDYRAIETYRCAQDVTVRTPIVAFTGDDDPRTTLDEALAWQRHTEGGFDVRVFPGGHFFLTAQAPAVIAALGEYVSAQLSR